MSKAKAKAIADGFLDDIGSSKSGLRLRETFSELIILAGELVEEAQKNLNKKNTNASGNLSSSLEVSEPEVTGSIISVDIYMNYYGKFVNKGVKGTKSGSGLYAFKYEHPSKKMLHSLKEWVNNAKLKTANTNKKKTISKNEKKNASIGEIDNTYALGRSILQHGIKKTGFLDDAVTKTQRKVKERLGLALKVDIIDALETKEI